MIAELAVFSDFKKENVLKILGKCEKEIYDVLSQNPGTVFTKEDLASATVSNYSPTSGGFNNALARLNTLGLLQKQGSMIQLNGDILSL